MPLLQTLLTQARKILGNATDVAILTGLLDKVLPSKLQPVAKAAVPALLSLLGFAALVLQAGSVNSTAATELVTGLVGSGVTYALPNRNAALRSAAPVFDPPYAGHPDEAKPSAAQAVDAAPTTEGHA